MTDFFIGDCHFSHKKIIEFCSESRPFSNIAQHDQTLIKNWNSVVNEDDTVHVCGDFYLGGYRKEQEIKEILSKLKGNKILIQGNHDLNRSPSQWRRLGFVKVIPMLVYKGCLVTHIPIDIGEIRGQSKRGRYIANIHSHLHDEGNTHELNSTGRFCVSAECIYLTPISWDDLWNKICKVGGKYLPLSEAELVTFAGEGTIQLGKYDMAGRRMKGELVSINSKQSYPMVYPDLDNTGVIGIGGFDSPIVFVKSKNFIGIVPQN